MTPNSPYPALEDEARSHVDTACAAYHLCRKPRTLRAWASGEIPGPIQPKKVYGRLAWSVEELRKLLNQG